MIFFYNFSFYFFSTLEFKIFMNFYYIVKRAFG